MRTHDDLPSTVRFSTEAAFVARFRELFAGYLPQRGAAWRISSEVSAGRRIADVVALLTDDDDTSRRARALLTIGESVVLSVLRKYGPTRIDLLERRCGVGRGDFRGRALARLREWDLLGFQPGGRVVLQTASPSFLIAVEAKLTRWRDALRQAVEYRRYADEAFVALPKEHSARAAAAAVQFQECGVGLFVVSGDSIETIVPPRLSEKHDWRREFVLSRLGSVRA